MDWAVYGALIAGFLAIAGAATFVAVRALEAWRSFKRLRRGLGRELDRLAALAERAAEGASRAGDQTKLAQSLARLHVSLAQLAVLRNALDEAGDTVARLTWIYPRR